MKIYDLIRLQKRDMLSMLEKVWAKTKDIPEEKIEKNVEEALRAVRKQNDQKEERR